VVRGVIGRSYEWSEGVEGVLMNGPKGEGGILQVNLERGKGVL